MTPGEPGPAPMSTIESRNFSLALFQTLPEFEPPLEFFAQKVVQKMSPKIRHSWLQTDLTAALLTFSRPRNLGRPFTELRCVFGGESHVFDVSFFVQGRLPDLTRITERADITDPPDLAIEILSPGQVVGEMILKLRSALRRGVRSGWLIDTKRRRVHVLHPTGPAQALVSGDVLSGAEIVPGFTLPIDELFGWLAGN